MKKKIILFSILILLTGCSAEYNLYIGDKFTDDLLLTEDNEKVANMKNYNMEDNTIFYEENYAYQISVLENGFDYTREEISLNNKSGYHYNYSYNIDEINKMSMIYDCYEDINVSKNKRVIIETSNEFKCFNKYNLLDDVTVKIHYKGKLIDTNADTIDDGTYIWKINKDNYANKKIYLETEAIKESHTFDIIGAIILGILIIILLLLLKKFNSNKD